MDYWLRNGTSLTEQFTARDFQTVLASSYVTVNARIIHVDKSTNTNENCNSFKLKRKKYQRFYTFQSNKEKQLWLHGWIMRSQQNMSYQPSQMKNYIQIQIYGTILVRLRVYTCYWSTLSPLSHLLPQMITIPKFYHRSSVTILLPRKWKCCIVTMCESFTSMQNNWNLHSLENYYLRVLSCYLHHFVHVKAHILLSPNW